MLDLNKESLIKLNMLINEFSLQAEEIIGTMVEISITGISSPSNRDKDVEDFTIALIKSAVCEMYLISVEVLESSRRTRPLPDARFLAYKAIKQLLPFCPLKKIGAAFGDRDHSTVIHGIHALDGLMKNEPDLAVKYETLIKKITT